MMCCSWCDNIAVAKKLVDGVTKYACTNHLFHIKRGHH